MRHFIVIFFCSFLSSGNLHSVDNENNYPYQSESAMFPVVEEHNWPGQSYQTFRGNFYGTARRSINAKPCGRQISSPDINIGEKEISFQQPTDKQPEPTPTRRSSVSKENFQPQILDKGRSKSLRVQTQILKDEESNALDPEYQVLNEEESNTLISQPQDIRYEESKTIKALPQAITDDGSNTLPIKTQVIRDEESKVFKNQSPANEALNTLGMKNKFLSDEESNASQNQAQNVQNKISNTFKVKTKIIKNESSTLRKPTLEDTNTFRTESKLSQEDSNFMQTNSQEINDDSSNIYRIQTQVLQDNDSNNLKTQPQHSSSEGLNTYKVEPQVLKDNGPSTFRTQNQVIKKYESYSPREFEMGDNFQNLESINEKKPMSDNPLTISGKDIEVEESEHTISAPEYEVQRIGTYTSERSTDHLESPPIPDRKPLMGRSKIICAENKHDAALSPQTQRRFLINSKNKGGTHEIPTFGKNTVIRSDNANKGDTYVFTNEKALRTNPDDNENQINNQNTTINTKSNNNEQKWSEAQNPYIGRSGSGEKSLEKSLQRAGKIQFVIGPKTNVVKDPTKGQGISYIKKGTLMLMDYDRVCYACSTANSPVCLVPDRRTGVKYCGKGDNGCVTKTFGSGNTLTLIRDCGRSCADSETPGLVPSYKSCEICYSDLCNSAYSINVHSLILILSNLVIIVLVKPLL